MDLSELADDVPPNALDGITLSPGLERRIFAGPVHVPADALTLGHEVFQLYRKAAYFHGDNVRHPDPSVADRCPPERVWNLLIANVAAYLARVLGPELRTTTMHTGWSNALGVARKRRDGLTEDGRIDVALRLRETVLASLSSCRGYGPARETAWANFQMALKVLGPIFAGEVTRADLSA